MMWASALVRIYLKITLPFIAAFLALNATASAVGSRLPPNPALEGFTVGCEGMSQPCWYGIVPGETTVREGERLLNEADYLFKSEFEGCGVSLDWTCYIYESDGCLLQFAFATNYRVIEHLELGECGQLMVGEMVLALGTPKAVQYKPNACSITISNFWEVSFRVAGWQKPHAAVENIYIVNKGMQTSCGYSREAVSSWHGFAPQWKYCQLEPTFVWC